MSFSPARSIAFFLLQIVLIFCMLGFDNCLSLYTFRYRWGSTLLFKSSSFHTGDAKCLCLLLAASIWLHGSPLFLLWFFKIIPGFVVTAFVATAFRLTGLQALLWKYSIVWHSNFFSMQTAFRYSCSLGSLMKSLLLILYFLKVTASTLHGVWR